MSEFPLVSIIIRTCGKPSVLYNALKSVEAQYYPNIETIIIEDGTNISESFIKETFSDLQLHYYSTGINQGRTKAGNIGLSLSSGQYINFLDEDDIFLPMHVQTLIDSLEATGAKAVYSVAEERQIIIKSTSPYLFDIKRKLIRYRHPFNRLLLCYMNVFPIQSVMFSRSLYEKYGGFDEKLDILEDWDLWLRYALNEPFQFVDTVTSVYYTPYKNAKKRKRDAALQNAQQQVIEKHKNYYFTADAMQVNKEMEYILNTFNQKGFLIYMRKIRNFLLYHDR